MALPHFLLVQLANVVGSVQRALQFNHAILLVLLNVVFLLLALLHLVNFLLREAALVLCPLDFLSQIVNILVLTLDKVPTVGDLVLELLLS